MLFKNRSGVVSPNIFCVRLFQMVAGLTLLSTMLVLPLHAQTNLPPLELVVQSIDGPSAEYRADTETTWHGLEESQTLNKGDHIRTGDQTTVTLEVPGISLLKVVPGTTMQLTQLNRTTEERGLLTAEDITVNEIDIETEEGKVTNSVRQHEGVATEYDLKTPNAVAGVRGTSFQCEVTDFGRTECGVGDGEVQFASRANPEQSVTLQGGQKSAMNPDATAPSDPEQLGEEEASEIQQVTEASEQALTLPPYIEGINLNGTAFDQSIRLEYSEASDLTLAGEADAAEEGESLESLTVSVNGEPVSVEGTSNWSVTQTPEVPEEGTEVTAQIQITATDSNDKTTTRELAVTLVNPEETGQAPSEIPPENYEDGNVPVDVATVVGRPVSEMEFPFHAYKGDATSEGLMVEGTASGDATIEGVAYSLDGGQTWELATGSENWQVPIPSQSSGEYTVDVVAWTTDGVIGEPVEIGPIEYEAVSYSQAIREVFAESWNQFSNENTSEFFTYFDQDFLVEFANGESGDRNEFENEFSNHFFPDVENLRVDYTLNQIFSTPTGGEIVVDRLVWEGLFTEGTESRSFEAVPDGSYTFQRQADGQYKYLSFEDFVLALFTGASTTDIGPVQDNFGLEGIGPAIDNSGFDPFYEILEGDIIVGLDNQDYKISADSRPQFYVNDGPQSFYLGGGTDKDFPIKDGGIAELDVSSFEEITTIPEFGDSKYKKIMEVREGRFYAVIVSDQETGAIFSYVIHVDNIAGTAMDVEVVEGEAIGTDFQAVENFRGANPLDN